MSIKVVILALSLCLLPLGRVWCSYFCKDSTVDSITRATDQNMVFITSGGRYWWMRFDRFPLEDKLSKELPNGFKQGKAATYIDLDNGCKKVQARAQVTGFTGKYVWILEIVGGRHMVMAFDAKLSQFDAPKPYDANKCLQPAKVDWNKPIDAMFTRNYLEVYLVQGSNYVMVDCNFLCTDPENKMGEVKDVHPITDFDKKPPISAMFVFLEANFPDKLVVFQPKVYYNMIIDKRLSVNGKMIATNVVSAEPVQKFFYLTNESECTAPVTQPPLVDESQPAANSDAPPPGDGEQTGEPDAGNIGSEAPQSANPEGSGSGLWIIIVIIVIVLILVAVGLCLLFAMKAKKTEDTEASKPGAEGGVAATPSKPVSKTGSKVDSKAGGPSKAGGAPVSPKKSPVTSKIGTTASTRSGMGKSTIPKSSTGTSSKK